MTAAIIAAFTALSISSPSGYRFTTPATSNLSGKTYVLTGGRIPRAEDIAFLREAYAERNFALSRAASDATVPGSLLFGGGKFHHDFTNLRGMFAPSFGVWRPYYAYTDGYFLKRGVEIATDLAETGPDYAWTNGQDTSRANTIRAWVTPASAAIPTNGLAMAYLSGILTATNGLHSSLNTNYVNSLMAAYSVLTKQYNVLSVGECWSHGERRVYDNTEASRSVNDYSYEDYTYEYYGKERTGSRLVSYGLSPWDSRRTVFTNDAPFAASFYGLTGEQQKRRVYGWQFVKDDEKEYYQVGEDYVSGMYSSDGIYGAEGSGNALATCRGLDATLTNTIEDVKCFLVCRFWIEKYEDLSWSWINGQKHLTGPTNYYVTVCAGSAKRTARVVVSSGGTNTVWDTGVPLLRNLSAIADGLGVREWASAAQYKPVTIDCDPPTTGYDQERYATYRRRALICIADVYPYFYYRRKWNARLPAYDPE